MKKIKIIGSVIIIALVAYFISVVIRAANESNESKFGISYESNIEYYVNTFKAEYIGVMDEFEKHESGSIDAYELIDRLEEYYYAVSSQIDDMTENLPESTARDELYVTALNLKFFIKNITDYIDGGTLQNMEEGLEQAHNFVDLMNEFDDKYLS